MRTIGGFQTGRCVGETVLIEEPGVNCGLVEDEEFDPDTSVSNSLHQYTSD